MKTFSRRSVVHVSVGAAVAALGSMELVSGVAAREQPNMEAALRALRAAMESLERAAPNKGGHRDRAMRLVSEAMREVRAGMAFADGY